MVPRLPSPLCQLSSLLSQTMCTLVSCVVKLDGNEPIIWTDQQQLQLWYKSHMSGCFWFSHHTRQIETNKVDKSSLKNSFTQVQWQCQGTWSKAHVVPYHWWNILYQLPYTFPMTKRVWSRECLRLRPPILARGKECRTREYYIEFHPEHSPMFSSVLRSHVTSFHTFHPNSPFWNINTLWSP